MGIRPCFYYSDDEIVGGGPPKGPLSRPTMNVEYDMVKELQPAEALIIGKDGKVSLHTIAKKVKSTPCSFERIYFSRGSDADIYKERKTLGRLLVPQILHEIACDFGQQRISFIPNTGRNCLLRYDRGDERISGLH